MKNILPKISYFIATCMSSTICFKDSWLLLYFQKLPLAATLILPSLVISKEIVGFGTCLVGQPREMQFTLENPSASASYWTVTIGKSFSSKHNAFKRFHVWKLGAVFCTELYMDVIYVTFFDLKSFYNNFYSESRSDTCEEDTFRIEPSEGTLEPFITHVSNSKTQVKVFFTAK